ncbi:MAG: hypothetical protein GIW97_05115 [Candidatus Eremiobacteraeota bacterium]|nr:hypothetical protein [Candidatus Eremiobacteraeota bacterium]
MVAIVFVVLAAAQTGAAWEWLAGSDRSAAKCPLAQSNSGSAAKQLDEEFSAAFRRWGSEISTRDMHAVPDASGGTISIHIDHGKFATPTAQCIAEARANRSLSSGYRSAFTHTFVGTVSKRANSVQVTLKLFVTVPYGPIMGWGDANGTDRRAVEQAIYKALESFGGF